jgi:hypothetical protein
MASGKIEGQYVFHLEGIMWANSLLGGRFHPTMDVVISDLLPERKPFTDVELPIMTGLVDPQYNNGTWPFGNHQWPPLPPLSLPGGIPPAYVPNVGFYPFTEIGTFDFSDDGTVTAFIRWNFAGLLTGDFRPFSGKYELETEQVIQQPGGPRIPIGVEGAPLSGKISVTSPQTNGMPQWDYVFLFTDLETRAEALLMAAGRSPRPAAASGRMILR